ncbi:hypothetical protein ACFX58_09880 [Sphingomonas sp. NCPPB 2930]
MNANLLIEVGKDSFFRKESTMGQCASTGHSSSADYTSYYSPDASPASSPQRSATARNSDDGAFAGLSRRSHPSAGSSGTGSVRHAVDFSSSRVEQQTTTERGETLNTTKLDLCTGVAVGGVKYNRDGSIGETSVSVFHVLPDVRSPGVPIARKVQELTSAGFEVNAYVAGGDGSSRAGQATRSAIEGMLAGMGVSCQSAPHSNGEYSQVLSATIDHDGTIQYANKRVD